MTSAVSDMVMMMLAREEEKSSQAGRLTGVGEVCVCDARLEMGDSSQGWQRAGDGLVKEHTDAVPFVLLRSFEL